MHARFRAPRAGRANPLPFALASVHELPRHALRRLADPAPPPVLVDPPPAGSLAELADLACRLVDELAAVIESNLGQLGRQGTRPIVLAVDECQMWFDACRVVLGGLGEAHVLLDELAHSLRHVSDGSPDVPPTGGAA
ncbi:MAG TPA: hypothetical protein VMU51_10835 [Mycobacteriales bacterium]|nr:hypothetical protein [Mycobacteriales bacterium]